MDRQIQHVPIQTKEHVNRFIILTLAYNMRKPALFLLVVILMQELGEDATFSDKLGITLISCCHLYSRGISGERRDRQKHSDE